MLDEPGRSHADKERFLSQLDEIERLTRIVEGLTLLSRADANQLPLSREPVALDELVREAAENAQALGEPQGIKVHLESPPEISVVADRHRLRQILLILCDNAVKYNRPGGHVSITLKAEASTASVSVKNTGPGIEAEEESRVFERFHRGSNAAALDIEGCGLGLSIALWIAQAHGGSLKFSSRPDETNFVLAMPLKRD
jgi:signal transduction histidine kinase